MVGGPILSYHLASSYIPTTSLSLMGIMGCTKQLAYFSASGDNHMIHGYNVYTVHNVCIFIMCYITLYKLYFYLI